MAPLFTDLWRSVCVCGCVCVCVCLQIITARSVVTRMSILGEKKCVCVLCVYRSVCGVYRGESSRERVCVCVCVSADNNCQVSGHQDVYTWGEEMCVCVLCM